MAVSYTHLTGPRAPHVSKICLRQDLGKLGDTQEQSALAEAFPGNLPTSGGDVMVVVKEYSQARSVHQVFTAWPAGLCGVNLHPEPPVGSLHPRRFMAVSDRSHIARQAEEQYAARSTLKVALPPTTTVPGSSTLDPERDAYARVRDPLFGRRTPQRLQ